MVEDILEDIIIKDKEGRVIVKDIEEEDTVIMEGKVIRGDIVIKEDTNLEQDT